jgi:hypothetical protein
MLAGKRDYSQDRVISTNTQTFLAAENSAYAISGFFSFHYTSFVFLLHRNPVPCPVDTGGGWDMVVSIRARLPAWVGLPSVMLT